MAPPDWTGLPLDILVRIVGPLEFPDSLAAAAVCTTWRAATSPAVTRAALPRRALRIFAGVERPAGEDQTAASAAVVLYDTSSRRIHRIPGLPAGGRTLLGSAGGGWLCFASLGEYQLSFSNPFTGADIAGLPPGPYRRSYPCLDNLRLFLSFTFAISGAAAMLIRPNRRHCNSLWSARPGDDGWKEMNYIGREGVALCDCISHRGKFLTVDEEGAIMEWDDVASSRPRPLLEAPWRIKSGGDVSNDVISLVAAPWGELLLVCRDCELFPSSLRPRRQAQSKHIQVFAVDLLAKTARRMTDLQGHALVVCSRHCCLLSVDSHHPALLPDCIYYLGYSFRWMEGSHAVDAVSGIGAVYSLRSETLVQPFPPSLMLPMSASSKLQSYICHLPSNEYRG